MLEKLKPVEATTLQEIFGENVGFEYDFLQAMNHAVKMKYRDFHTEKHDTELYSRFITLYLQQTMESHKEEMEQSARELEAGTWSWERAAEQSPQFVLDNLILDTLKKVQETKEISKEQIENLTTLIEKRNELSQLESTYFEKLYRQFLISLTPKSHVA